VILVCSAIKNKRHSQENHNSDGLSKKQAPCLTLCHENNNIYKYNYSSIAKHVSLPSNKNLLDELIAYSPLIRSGPHRKRHMQQFFIAAEMCLISHCLVKTGEHTNTHVQQFFCCCEYSLPRGCVYRAVPQQRGEGGDPDGWAGFIKYTVQTGSSAMICIPSFIKIGSGIQTLIEGDTHTIEGKVMSQVHFIFFKIRSLRIDAFMGY
jgi:hypothetical protein